MDDVSSQRQILQMVNFILNEARDKAEEIDARTLEEFNIERLKELQTCKDKIRAEYTKKLKAAETQRAIARSSAINRSRLQKIEARQKYLLQLKGNVGAECSSYLKGKDSYGKLLVDLICQGCIKLLEGEVVVRCKKEDQSIVKSILDSASSKFTEVMKAQTGQKLSVKLSLDSQYLDTSCIGGVVCLCQGNSISVDNTLDERLELVMSAELPKLRTLLFPQK